MLGRSFENPQLSVALWLREARRAGGKGQCFELNPRSVVALWVMRHRQLPGCPHLWREGSSEGTGRAGVWSGGLRQEMAKFGGLGKLQGSGEGSSPLLRLSFLLLRWSFPIGLSFLGLGVSGVGVWGVQKFVSRDLRAGVSWRRSLGWRWLWNSVHQWFLDFLAGGVKYLWLREKQKVLIL